MLIKVLGKPDSEFIANEIQQDLGIPSMAGWIRVWHWTDVDGSKRISKIKLWFDYDARGNTDGKIHLSILDDHPELSENELLKLANLRNKKNFEVKFIRWAHDNSVIGGIEVFQRP